MAVLLFFGLLASGCGRPTSPLLGQDQEIYPIAAWYYVKGYVPETKSQARDVMAGDFSHLRSLGFNAIVADAIKDDRRGLLLDVAERQSMQVILPHARTMAFVRGGQFNRAVLSEPKSVVRENVQQVGRHPALYMHYVYDAPSADVAERLAEIVTLYRRLDPAHPVFVALNQGPAALARHLNLSVVLWDNFPLAEDARPGELMNRRYATPSTHVAALADIYAATPDRHHWAMVQAVAIPGRVRFPTPAEMNVIYLAALGAGFVDGVVFYRYHTDESPDSGLAPANRAMAPERTAAVRQVTKRASTWGPMLTRTRPATDPIRLKNGRLHATVLSGPKRQFVLVYNPDVVTFGHDTVYLPTTVQGRSVIRAVNVDEPKRYGIKGSPPEIPIVLRLSPGEGRLFELFGP